MFNISGIINFVIGLIEGAEPAFAPFLEAVKADITAGKNVTLQQIEDTLDAGLLSSESIFTKYAKSLEAARVFLRAGEALITAIQSDTKAV